MSAQEDSFHLVDNRPTQRNRGGPRRFGPNRFQQAQRQREAEAAAAADSKHRQPRKKQQARMMNNYQRSDQRVSAFNALWLVGWECVSFLRHICTLKAHMHSMHPAPLAL